MCKHKQLIKQMSVKGYDRVFAVGNNASRVTFASQQRRALNLIWALAEERKLGPEMNLAVVGGGLAGMTAALAAESLGMNVTIIEEKNDLMHLQRGNSSRYIHPNIFDWPTGRSTVAITDLPFLNWSEDICSSVAAWILEQWDQLKSGIKERNNTEAILKEETADNVVLILNGSEERFDLVLLCVGFGLERQIDEVPFLSYWENDNLSRPSVRTSEQRRVLVSGTGDGALIDIARLLIVDFEHGEFSRLLYSEELDDLCKIFLEIERQLNDKIRKGEFGSDLERDAGVWLYLEYSKIKLPEAIKAKLRIRTDTHVTVHSRSGTLFSVRASLINRFTVWMLHCLNAFEFESGDMKFVRSSKLGIRLIQWIDRQARRFLRHSLFGQLSLGPPFKTSFRGEHTVCEFDDVLITYGPIGAFGRVLKDKTLGVSMSETNMLDDTYEQLYPQYFSKYLVYFHNGLLETLAELTWFRHAARNLTYLTKTLRADPAVLSVGYLLKGRRFEISAQREEVGSLPKVFMNIPVQVDLRPRRGIVHDNLKPIQTDQIECGFSVEFDGISAASDAELKIGFFINAGGTSGLFVPFVPNVAAGTKVFRAEMKRHESTQIGEVMRVIEPRKVSEDPPTWTYGGVLIALGPQYSAENRLTQSGISVAAPGAPKAGEEVLIHRHQKPCGKVVRVDFRAAIRTARDIIWFNNCFNVIPTTAEPFADVGDLGSLIVTADGRALGIVIGTSLGQAVALPMEAILQQLDVELMKEKYTRKAQGSIHLF
ncbi:MAG: NAD(P)/FAD-dependent oxidoreductase [Candidatus Obscuribacterales bacterium]|nr:NAD(P)/FAD-dependent oxidoreductase [Candidatus Obscuribacterales bacterium]